MSIPPPPPPSINNLQSDEHEIIDEYIRAFLLGCRIQPPSQTSIATVDQIERDKTLENFYSKNRWHQILEYINASPFSETLNIYLKSLLDYSTLESSFCYHIESLFHTNNFDEILNLVSHMLKSLESNVNDTLTECSIVLQLLIIEVKTMTGQTNESIESLHTLETSLVSTLTNRLEQPTDSTISNISTKHDSCQQWYYVTLLMKINICIRQRHHEVAIQELVGLLAMSTQDKNNSGRVLTNGAETQIVLLCHLSKLCIQVFSYSYSYSYFNLLLFCPSMIEDRYRKGSRTLL